MMTQEPQRYNGWANYESWCIGLWIDNDFGSYWADRAQEIWDELEDTVHHCWTRSEQSRFTLADEMKDYFHENSPLADQANVYSDLLNAALSEVDWSEVANAQFCDVDGYEGDKA